MKNTAKAKVPENVRAIIKEAVEAGRRAERFVDDPYKRTEKRLFAIPALFVKVEDDGECLEELKVTQRLPERSRDLTRFSKGGIRVTPEEQLEAVIKNKRAEITIDQHEIETVRKAISMVEDDEFYLAIQAKYFGGADDKEIAAVLYCDARTVQRHRSRIISQLSVRFYGAEAVR